MVAQWGARASGVLVALVGVVAVSPDAMLLRWMRSLGAASPDVAVAKYIGIIAFMLVLGLVRGLGGACESPRHFLASALCQLLYQLSFTFCLLLTDAATALLLISLAPLWAALLGVLTMSDSLPRRTVLALSLSLVGVLLVFAPRLRGSAHEDDSLYVPSPHGSLVGDLLALFTGFTQGASITVNRHAALNAPRAELTLATALSSLAATVFALYLPCYDTSDPHNFWACTPPVWRTPLFLVLAVCDALSVASFYTAMLIAPRFITGGEVSLILLLELGLAPLWVFLRFGDVPSPWTVAGGTLLLVTLAWHEFVALSRGRKQDVGADEFVVEECPYHRVDGTKAGGPGARTHT